MSRRDIWSVAHVVFVFFVPSGTIDPVNGQTKISTITNSTFKRSCGTCKEMTFIATNQMALRDMPNIFLEYSLKSTTRNGIIIPQFTA